MLRILFAVALLCAAVLPARAIEGMASWYGAESGRRTASGERFNPNGMTCAMRSFRRGQQRSVTVTVIATGKSAACRVNDHGPAAWTGRIIDVSAGMAKVLGFYARGVARVRVQ
jgi:rare lipoprotein A